MHPAGANGIASEIGFERVSGGHVHSQYGGDG
jgi:hypothetical protein